MDIPGKRRQQHINRQAKTVRLSTGRQINTTHTVKAVTRIPAANPKVTTVLQALAKAHWPVKAILPWLIQARTPMVAIINKTHQLPSFPAHRIIPLTAIILTAASDNQPHHHYLHPALHQTTLSPAPLLISTACPRPIPPPTPLKLHNRPKSPITLSTPANQAININMALQPNNKCPLIPATSIALILPTASPPHSQTSKAPPHQVIIHHNLPLRHMSDHNNNSINNINNINNNKVFRATAVKAVKLMRMRHPLLRPSSKGSTECNLLATENPALLRRRDGGPRILQMAGQDGTYYSINGCRMKDNNARAVRTVELIFTVVSCNLGIFKTRMTTRKCGSFSFPLH